METNYEYNIKLAKRICALRQSIPNIRKRTCTNFRNDSDDRFLVFTLGILTGGLYVKWYFLIWRPIRQAILKGALKRKQEKLSNLEAELDNNLLKIGKKLKAKCQFFDEAVEKGVQSLLTKKHTETLEQGKYILTSQFELHVNRENIYIEGNYPYAQGLIHYEKYKMGNLEDSVMRAGLAKILAEDIKKSTELKIKDNPQYRNYKLSSWCNYSRHKIYTWDGFDISGRVDITLTYDNVNHTYYKKNEGWQD